MHGMHDAVSMSGMSAVPSMQGFYGAYPVTRESSGKGVHFMSERDPNAYSMVHGFINFG
jgi:hypothetical protein